MNNNYIDINKTKTISGRTIINATVGKFIRIKNNDKKLLIKRSAISINPYAMYRISYFPEFIKIYPAPEAGVAMTNEEYANLMNDGNDLINRMFGDLIK